MTSNRARPPYVQTFHDRHGRIRFYFRRPGYPRKALPGPLHSLAFWAAYQAAMNAVPVTGQAGVQRSQPYSLSTLIASYYRSPAFLGLKESTRVTYRSIIEPLREKHGHRSVKDMRKSHVIALIAHRSDTPAAANNLLKRIKTLMKHAIDLDWRTDNPADGVASYRTESEGIHTWDEGEITRFLAVHPRGTSAHLCMMLMLYTGAALADVVKLGWGNIKNERLVYRRIKTNRQKSDVVVDIPIHPELLRLLADIRRDTFTFLETRGGRSRSAKGLGSSMRRWCQAADLPECSAHGLRKAMARRLADAGASAHEIAAVTGHRTLSEVQRYASAADRSRLGGSAIGKLLAGAEGEQKVSKHPLRFDNPNTNPLTKTEN